MGAWGAVAATVGDLLKSSMAADAQAIAAGAAYRPPQFSGGDKEKAGFQFETSSFQAPEQSPDLLSRYLASLFQRRVGGRGQTPVYVAPKATKTTSFDDDTLFY